jgi:hypothetical protein
MQEKNQKKEKFCKNCDYLLRPEDKFCSQCGQNAKTKRLNLKQTRKDLLRHLALHAFLGGFRTVLFMLVFAPFVVVLRDHYHTVLLFYFGLWTVYVAWANWQLFEEAMWLIFLKNPCTHRFGAGCDFDMYFCRRRDIFFNSITPLRCPG